jgi:hypothetical protein
MVSLLDRNFNKKYVINIIYQKKQFYVFIKQTTPTSGGFCHLATNGTSVYERYTHGKIKNLFQIDGNTEVI